MTDAELDRILNAWEAPPPPPGLRQALHTRLTWPRRRFFRPLRWALAIAAASFTLVIATEQPAANPLVSAVNRFWENVLQSFEAWRITAIVDTIRKSDPKVYVDGLPAAPPRFTHAALLEVDVPGEGVYIVTLGKVRSWTEAGRIRGNVLEFRAGEKHVTIECNRTLVDADRPVFVRRP